MRRMILCLAVAVSAISASALGTAGTLPTAPGGRAVGVIVEGVSGRAAAAAVRHHGGRVVRDLPIVEGVAARVPAPALAALARDPGVRAVSPDGALAVQADASPVHEASAVFPNVVGADRLWKGGWQGAGVGVALIDTGISKVGDLAGRVRDGVDLTDEGNPYLDSFGHGTFVAGILAGDGAASDGANRGVAPKADLVPVKIAGRSGATDVSHVLAAIQWVVSFRDKYGIRVVNLSLGTDSTQPYLRSPLNYAVERAWDAGIVVVVSASNSGPAPKTVAKPGDDPLVVTVGAVDDQASVTRDDDVMAGFSGVGPTAADGLVKPDLVAPGRSVLGLRSPGSAVDDANPASRVGSDYFRGSGTSFSAAVVSGAAALLLDKEPALTPDQVKHRLTSTAAPGPVGELNVDGAGSLDVYAAATAGTLTAANQGVQRSRGQGAMRLDRGSLDVAAGDGNSREHLKAERTAQ
ncbi:MAG: serine protease AprX, partial [Actinomycetota bacterium]|nr:serine protease AprX [Actinomycetota bacterium]